MRIIVSVICVFVMLSSCELKTGSGKVVTAEKQVGSFTGVDISNGFETEIKIGPAQKVVVEADDNFMKDIIVEVNNGELRVHLDNVSVNDAHLKLFITAPQITTINASGGAEVTVKDQLTSQAQIKLSASGGANVTASVDAPGVKADASGGGEVTVSGHTKDLDAKSSSGSSVKASKLLTENCKADASSGATIDINASVSIEAEASSGGDVTYRGDATVKKSESSGGEVKKEN